MTSVEDALANTLRSMRERKGYSQKSVSDAIGTTSATISRWESLGVNGRVISPTSLYQISSLYESTPSEVYEIASTEVTLDDLIKPKKGNNDVSDKISTKKKK